MKKYKLFGALVMAVLLVSFSFSVYVFAEEGELNQLSEKLSEYISKEAYSETNGKMFDDMMPSFRLKPNEPNPAEDSDIVIIKDNGKSYATGLVDKTSVAELKAQFANNNFAICDTEGNPLADDAKLATGQVIRLYTDSTVVDEITIVVAGDTTGDGDVTTLDALNALRSSVGLTVLEKPYQMAADVNGSGVSTSDALMILRYAVGLEASLGK